MPALAQPRGWQARLELGFAPRHGRTVLARRRHQGPLVVQRPFYPEGAPCHAYLLHPPGGVVGGDRLTVELEVDAGAHAVVTTPASGKFYRAEAEPARQVQRLRVRRDGVLEWLPQDTILFAGARADLATRVELDPGARFIGWEILCLGRPAAGEAFQSGHCRQRLELWRGERPLLLERARFEGGGAALTAPWGLAGRTVTGTLVAAPCGAVELDAVRAALRSDDPEALLSATLLDDVLVCRCLGARAEAARNAFVRAWEALRPVLLQRPASAPRIWRT